MNFTIPVTTLPDEHFPVKILPTKTRKPPEFRRRRFKHIRTIGCALIAIPLLASCASAPLALPAVGPGPFAHVTSPAGTGQLQVYTEPEEYFADQWLYYPHSDYQLYDANGKRLRRVWNHNTHEDELPAIVSLAPGTYLIEARAEFHGLVKVPVLIEAHKLTRVILQPGWTPRAKFDNADLVQFPKGYPIGWSATVAQGN